MNRNRFPEIDALRALAVLLVVWSHTSNIEIGIGGFHGVLLFFVISGFLITGILLEARGSAPAPVVLRAFYIRRFLRIFPIYYLVLLLATGIGIPSVKDAFPWHLTYLSNWYYSYVGQFDKAAHLWSLAVEEQFYLFWPWFVLLLPSAALPWTLGAMILTGPASRLLLGSAGANEVAAWITTPTVLDALGFGCLWAYLSRQIRSTDRLGRWVLFSSLLLIALQTLGARLGLSRNPIFAFAIYSLGWRLLCLWFIHRAACGVPGLLGRLLRARPLVYIGTISYAIYLIHPFVMPTVAMINHRFGVHVPIPDYPGRRQFLSVALISIAAASLSWKFFERPINLLKNRFPYVPAEPRVAVQVEMPGI